MCGLFIRLFWKLHSNSKLWRSGPGTLCRWSLGFLSVSIDLKGTASRLQISAGARTPQMDERIDDPGPSAAFGGLQDSFDQEDNIRTRRKHLAFIFTKQSGPSRLFVEAEQTPAMRLSSTGKKFFTGQAVFFLQRDGQASDLLSWVLIPISGLGSI